MSEPKRPCSQQFSVVLPFIRCLFAVHASSFSKPLPSQNFPLTQPHSLAHTIHLFGHITHKTGRHHGPFSWSNPTQHVLGLLKYKPAHTRQTPNSLRFQQTSSRSATSCNLPNHQQTRIASSYISSTYPVNLATSITQDDKMGQVWSRASPPAINGFVVHALTYYVVVSLAVAKMIAAGPIRLTRLVHAQVAQTHQANAGKSSSDSYVVCADVCRKDVYLATHRDDAFHWRFAHRASRHPLHQRNPALVQRLSSV